MNKKIEELKKDRQLYTEKVREIEVEEKLQEVSGFDFYRDIFPIGSFEPAGEYVGKENGIMTILHEDKRKGEHRIITDELRVIEEAKGKPDIIVAPIGWHGRRNQTQNARGLYAMAFDLDGQEMKHLRDTFHQMRTGVIPRATYVVLSGHGLHLYYVFKEPIQLTPLVSRELLKLKTALTHRIWNGYTSFIKKPQFQPIIQGFRMVGSLSKLGKGYPVRAWKVGDKVTVDDLNNALPDSKEYRPFRANLKNAIPTPIEQAKKMWPEWYHRRVELGRKPGQWTVKRDLYDWWLKRIREEVVDGHRYYGIMTLAIYAKKCGVSYQELRRDAYSLLNIFDSRTKTEDNHFTEKDIRAGLRAYQQRANKCPRDVIGKMAGLIMPVNKRNHRKQEVHLMGARAIQSINDKVNKTNWREGNGRPYGSGEKKDLVYQYRKEHPDDNVTTVARTLKMSRTTVYKWWDYKPLKYGTPEYEDQYWKEESEALSWEIEVGTFGNRLDDDIAYKAWKRKPRLAPYPPLHKKE